MLSLPFDNVQYGTCTYTLETTQDGLGITSAFSGSGFALLAVSLRGALSSYPHGVTFMKHRHKKSRSSKLMSSGRGGMGSCARFRSELSTKLLLMETFAVRRCYVKLMDEPEMPRTVIVARGDANLRRNRLQPRLSAGRGRVPASQADSHAGVAGV
jgi:hypothetical protein